MVSLPNQSPPGYAFDPGSDRGAQGFSILDSRFHGNDNLDAQMLIVGVEGDIKGNVKRAEAFL